MAPRPSSPSRTLVRALTAGLVLYGGTAVARAAWGMPTAMGAQAADLRERASGSPHAVDGAFRNTEGGVALPAGTVPAALRAALGRRVGRPARPVPVAGPGRDGWLTGPAAELAATWFGHSSVLLEIDGRRVLLDPMWSDRASPSPRLGPRRMHPVPAALDALPPVDAVVVSHDHYDHLDLPTIRALAADPRHGSAPFVVPLGLGAHLRHWGVPAERVVELDWDGAVEVAGLTVICAEARHFSGRGLRRNTTLWASWVVAGPSRRAYFGGDTGYTAAFARAGREWGPFDLTLLPIGAYADLWPDMHMTPEQAVRAHCDLNDLDDPDDLSNLNDPDDPDDPGPVLLPVHWATFNLGFHGWAEPVERLRAAAAEAGVRLALPVPGRRTDLTGPLPEADWWSPVA